MAVVNNFWLRDNKQKLGGAVIYQARGETLMRQLAPSVSNPRTDAQMEQRVKLANLVAFYRASQRWMHGAFEAKPNNQSDYNAFVSANAKSNAVWLTKSQVDAGVSVVAPYQVSRGTLGEIVQTIEESQIYTNLYVGDLEITATTTIAQFTRAILANNNTIVEGDQISVIQYIQNVATGGNYTITCRPYECVLSLSDNSLLSAYLPVDLLLVGVQDGGPLGFETAEFVGGVAFILSRTAGGRILVSSSSVTLTESREVYNAMTTDAQKNEAIRSYGEATTYFLDSNLASQSNANVPTSAGILGFVYNNATYTPGSVIPNPFTQGATIQILFSAPVNVEQGAAVDFNNEGGSQSIMATYDGAALTGVSSVTMTFERVREISVSPNEQVPVYMTFDGAADGTILRATFYVSGGLG